MERLVSLQMSQGWRAGENAGWEGPDGNCNTHSTIMGCAVKMCFYPGVTTNINQIGSSNNQCVVCVLCVWLKWCIFSSNSNCELNPTIVSVVHFRVKAILKTLCHPPKGITVLKMVLPWLRETCPNAGDQGLILTCGPNPSPSLSPSLSIALCCQ